MILWTAFIMGLLGSLHCVGMCVPITLSLPYGKGRVLRDVLTYHAGRVLTYTALGLLFGLVGQGLAVAGFQQSLSFGLGIIFIIIALFSINYEDKIQKITMFRHLTEGVHRAFGRLLRQRSGYFLLGILNGLLPCGMVYWAAAASVLTFSIPLGAAYMLLFGIGTMPMMVSAVLIGQRLKRPLLRQLYRFVPLYQFSLGIWLLYRAYLIDPAVFNLLNPTPICH
jgi:hypothetical protein